MAKGRQLGISGRLSYRTWDGDDGSPRSRHQLIASLAMAVEHGFAYAATVITNGLLMDPDRSARLVEFGVVAAQITLDGDRDRHDRTRHERGT